MAAILSKALNGAAMGTHPMTPWVTFQRCCNSTLQFFFGNNKSEEQTEKSNAKSKRVKNTVQGIIYKFTQMM